MVLLHYFEGVPEWDSFEEYKYTEKYNR